MQVEKDRSSHFGARTTGTSTAVASARKAQTRKKHNRAKVIIHVNYVLEHILSTINPSPSRLSAAWKKPRHKIRAAGEGFIPVPQLFLS